MINSVLTVSWRRWPRTASGVTRDDACVPCRSLLESAEGASNASRAARRLPCLYVNRQGAARRLLLHKSLCKYPRLSAQIAEWYVIAERYVVAERYAHQDLCSNCGTKRDAQALSSASGRRRASSVSTASLSWPSSSPQLLHKA